ncbi:hypothetical protein [Deinococcus sp. UR1]|nr:hypothetical protein [Deinococcus sp. UR1]
MKNFAAAIAILFASLTAAVNAQQESPADPPAIIRVQPQAVCPECI